MQIEKSLTPFQKKLGTLADIVGVYAKFICICSIIAFGIIWLLHVIFSDLRLVDEISIKRAIDLACTVAALLAVCIPEGMPLVISMATAFSVQALKKENLLIKNMDALETSGQITDVLTGKTATLTTGDMRVEVVHTQGGQRRINDLSITQSVRKELTDSIILNSDAHMQEDADTLCYVPHGSPVECGLLNFLTQSDNISVQDRMLDREDPHRY